MGDSCCYQCKKRCVGCKTNCIDWISEKTAKDLAAIQREKDREARDVINGYKDVSFHKVRKFVQLHTGRQIKAITR